MSNKFYLIEILDHSYSFSAFYEEFQGASYDEVLTKAKKQYPNSEMYNVYIGASHVSKSEGGNRE